MAKKNNPYFNDFIDMIEISCKAAEFLQDSLRNFSPATLSQRREEMHKLEHREDDIKHALMKRLVKEFVTPIDREDILHLASELDDVTDKIDDILIRMYMYNIKVVPEEAVAFAGVITECCVILRRALEEFPSLQKSAALKQAIIDVNTKEETGDAIYIAAVRRLYEQGGDPLEISAWAELFDRLEDCCDSCEHVADVIESIIMKNS